MRAVSVQLFGDRRKAHRVACEVGPTAGVVRADGKWALVTVRRAVHDDRAVVDAMRALPYDEWADAYRRLVKRHRPTARFTVAGVEGAAAGAVARGVEYWRVYYGAPRDGSDAAVLAKHVATQPLWSFATTRARAPQTRAEAAFAQTVRAATVRIARDYTRWLVAKGRAYDAAQMRSAFDLERGKLDVYILPGDSRLDGALYPAHSTHDRVPTRATMRENKRALAVKRGANLATLLAHEIAHALFPPVWQDENHPPAFGDAKAELAAIVAASGIRFA